MKEVGTSKNNMARGCRLYTPIKYSTRRLAEHLLLPVRVELYSEYFHATQSEESSACSTSWCSSSSTCPTATVPNFGATT